MFHDIPVLGALSEKFLIVVLAVLCVMFLLCLLRLVLGPSVADRLLAVNMLGRDRDCVHRAAGPAAGGILPAGHQPDLRSDQFPGGGDPVADLYRGPAVHAMRNEKRGRRERWMMVLEWIRFLAGAVCMAAGLVFYIIQFIGVFRFKYVLNRMHAAAIGDTLGAG